MVETRCTYVNAPNERAMAHDRSFRSIAATRSRARQCESIDRHFEPTLSTREIQTDSMHDLSCMNTRTMIYFFFGGGGGGERDKTVVLCRLFLNHIENVSMKNTNNKIQIVKYSNKNIKSIKWNVK